MKAGESLEIKFRKLISFSTAAGRGLSWYWCGALVAALTGLFFYDIEILRWYYGLPLPAWLWVVEHYVSKYSHLAAIGIGLLILGLRSWQWFRHGAVVVAASSLVVMCLKFGIGRVRPGNAGEPWLFFGINRVHDSYPSGHAVALWALVFVLLRFNRRLGMGFVVLGLVVAWARLHAQAHYPSDLVAGALVALACERILWWRFHSGELALRGGWGRQLIPWLVVVLLPVLAVLPVRSTILPRRTAVEYEVLIHALYERLLRREVDPGALALWQVELPRRRVVSDPVFQFAVSREFSDSISSAGATAEQVREIYERLLDRLPSEIESQCGVALLGSLDNPREHRYGIRLLAIRLILSAEYLARSGAFLQPGEPGLVDDY